MGLAAVTPDEQSADDPLLDAPVRDQPSPDKPASETGAQSPSFANWMGSLWLYTLLRFALFFALWVLFVLVGLAGLFAALLALALSVPLSFVLLAKPRARVAANIEQRVNARRT